MNISMEKQDPLLFHLFVTIQFIIGLQCFDLKNDPEDYFNMDMSTLKEAMKKVLRF